MEANEASLDSILVYGIRSAIGSVWGIHCVIEPNVSGAKNARR
jgi:hypothetical protein